MHLPEDVLLKVAEFVGPWPGLVTKVIPYRHQDGYKRGRCVKDHLSIYIGRKGQQDVFAYRDAVTGGLYRMKPYSYRLKYYRASS